MMNKILKTTILLLAFVSIFSCKKDEGSSTSFNIRPYAEQEPIDDDAIRVFLKNNYFNEEEFINANNINDFNFDIKFYLNEVLADQDEDGDDLLETNESVTGYDSNGDGVIDGNDVDNTTVFNRTPLIDYIDTVINGMTIETKTIEVGDVDHTLYIFKIIEGQGDEQPNFCDNVYISYEGISLEKEVFDNALNPIWLDLSKTVRGFSESASEFHTATGYVDNGDGIYNFQNYGVGAVFIPSGLAYYYDSVGTLPSYSPLIFKLKIYESSLTDHDNDGVPTFYEDLNQNHNLLDDDTDNDNAPNFTDTNDDNDPILTKNEDIDGDGDPTNDDTDGDGIPNYLDSDS